MKKLLVLLSCLALVLTFSTQVIAGKDGCTRIQDGDIYTPDGELIVLGYDEWGYNYQAPAIPDAKHS